MTYHEYLLKFGFARPESKGKAPPKPEEAAGEFVGETDKLEEPEETEEIGDAGETETETETETEDPGGLDPPPPPETPHKEPKPPKKGKAPAKK